MMTTGYQCEPFGDTNQHALARGRSDDHRLDVNPLARGAGQLESVPPNLVQGINELITLRSDQAKEQVIAEAKKSALIGGFLAGLIGVGVGYALARAMR